MLAAEQAEEAEAQAAQVTHKKLFSETRAS